MIKEFQGENRWLSNFFPAPQRDGTAFTGHPYSIYPQLAEGGTFVYPDNEHYFQAFKADNLLQHVAIMLAPSPAIAKKMAGPKGFIMPDGTLFKVSIRKDWPIVRVPVMKRGLILKYTQNYDLAVKLVTTFPQILEEGNRWHDEFWGVNLDTGKGENMLGRLSMGIRNLLMRDIFSISMKDDSITRPC